MNKSKKKPLYYNWAFWGVFIAAITVATSVLAYLIPNPNPKPYFSISVDPIQGTVQQGGKNPVNITISGSNSYDYPIYLSVVNPPIGITASFSPQSKIATPSFSSHVVFSASAEVIPSKNKITIQGIGADGEVHSCTYMLTVTQMEEHFVPIDVLNVFYPCGWMGDQLDIKYDGNCTTRPHSGNSCLKLEYIPSGLYEDDWAGIYWLYPDCNWGNLPEGIDLTGAERLTFWARGQQGGEVAEFKIGGIKGKYPSSMRTVKTTHPITLTTEWQPFNIDLSNQNLGHIIGGFCWVSDSLNNPNGCTIYVDDVFIE